MTCGRIIPSSITKASSLYHPTGRLKRNAIRRGEVDTK
jgi:hypothetical protein